MNHRFQYRIICVLKTVEKYPSDLGSVKEFEVMTLTA